MSTNATERLESDVSNDDQQTAVWEYGSRAAARAQDDTVRCDCGEELCWDCFKEDLEHFDVGESND